LCAVLYSECKRMSKERNYAANVYEMMMQQQQLRLHQLIFRRQQQ
jgi:hypothetical protein